jgi:hypothetical protein
MDIICTSGNYSPFHRNLNVPSQENAKDVKHTHFKFSGNEGSRTGRISLALREKHPSFAQFAAAPSTTLLELFLPAQLSSIRLNIESNYSTGGSC